MTAMSAVRYARGSSRVSGGFWTRCPCCETQSAPLESALRGAVTEMLFSATVALWGRIRRRGRVEPSRAEQAVGSETLRRKGLGL